MMTSQIIQDISDSNNRTIQRSYLLSFLSLWLALASIDYSIYGKYGLMYSIFIMIGLGYFQTHGAILLLGYIIDRL